MAKQGYVRIYRRHRIECGQKSQTYRRCSCPIYIEGKLGEETIRPHALNLTSWAAASMRVREWEAAGTTKATKRTTVKEAVALYEVDCEARELAPATRQKTGVLLKKFQEFADANGIAFLDDMMVPELRDFRASWETWGPLVKIKNAERLRAFFKFCVQSKWLPESPAKALKIPKPPKTHIVPYTDAELSKIHAAISRPIMRAFVYVLEFTGLRISDAVQLQITDIASGKLRIITEKTDEVVWLPLPPFVLAELARIKTTQYYFWTGGSKLSTVIGSKRRGIAKLLKRAGVQGNPHKFRHTLATNMLSNGTSTAIVAKVLGISEKIVLKHYSHWIPKRQAELERELQKTWVTPLLSVK
jgi:integrase